MGDATLRADPRVASFRAALDARPFSGLQIRMVVLLVVTMVVVGYDNQLISLVAPALSESWQVPRTAFGPVFSAGLLGAAAGALIFGPLADRLGGRRVLIGCTLWYAAMTGLSIFAATLPELMLLRALTGLGLGGAMPIVVVLVGDYSPARARSMMITCSIAAYILGGAVGGPVAAALLSHSDWRTVFLSGTVAPLVLTPFLVAWVPESLERLIRAPGLNERLKWVADRLAPDWVPPLAAAAAEMDEPARTSLAALFAKPVAAATALVWLTYFMNYVLLYLLANWLPLLIRSDGFSLDMASLSVTFYEGGGVVGALILTMVANRLRPQIVLTFTFVGAALFLAVLSLVGHNAPLVLALITGAGFFSIGGQIASVAFIGGFYPPAIRGAAVGWAIGVGRIGSISGPLLASALLAAGIQAGGVFRFCVVPALIAAAAVSLVRKPASA